MTTGAILFYGFDTIQFVSNSVITMTKHSEQEIYEVVERLLNLRKLLLHKPCTFDDIIASLPYIYEDSAGGQRKFRRDLHNLQALGYTIIEHKKPKRWSINSSSHIFSDKEIETMTHIREMYADGLPSSPAVQQLLANITQNLSPSQEKLWNRYPALHVPLKPVIDYTNSTVIIEFLESAITKRQQIAFLYQSRTSEEPFRYARVDPYEIEYTDRHFYLVGFSYRFGTILTFRIDRIIHDPSRQSPELLPDIQPPRRTRPQIYFTYQLPASFAKSGVSERFTIHAVRRLGDIVEIDASDTSEFRIIRTLLGYGEHATLVKAPQSLLDQMRTIVGKMAEKYKN
ncbi:MAG: WYL domain-containing protein [Herpetosiphon sp.]|nr:WYL domain-containing protein [Herpetosiphon sp.]